MIVETIETVLAAGGALYLYTLSRTLYDAHRFDNAENKIREKFDLDPSPIKYKEYPEGYAQDLETQLNNLWFPSFLGRMFRKDIVKKAYEKTAKPQPKGYVDPTLL